MRVGQQVIAQHLLSKRWDLRWEIIENRDNGRSYLVQINGRQYLRNRRFLRPLPKPQQQLVSHERQPMATNIQPTRDYNVRVQNQPPQHIYQHLTELKHRPPRLDRILERPQLREQNTTPTRIYPQRIRQQQTHYLATIPQPKRRNRPPTC